VPPLQRVCWQINDTYALKRVESASVKKMPLYTAPILAFALKLTWRRFRLSFALLLFDQEK
jgi:hypothetical protein